MKKDNSKYDLTQEEYNKCLAMAEIATFMNGDTVENPTSIFVVAQPGAGKTGLKSYVVNEAQDNRNLSSYIEFNPDDISIYHKYYQEILEEFPDESYQILQRFVKPALDTYLRQRAVELRNNIVQEGTFGNTDAYIKVVNFQKNGGNAQIGKLKEDGTREKKFVKGNYNIDINILAVDKFESLLSSYEREQYFRDNGLPPRVVIPEYHDDAYEKILETTRIIERKGLFNRIRVFKRGYSADRPELVYVSGDNKYPTAVEAVIAERSRNRQNLLRNSEGYLQRIYNLRERVKQNGIQQQLDRLGELEKLFQFELEKQDILNK